MNTPIDRSRLVSVIHAIKSYKALSKENTFSNRSSQSNVNNLNLLKDVTLNDGRDIIDGVVNMLFDKNKGMAVISSSSCTVDHDFKSSEHMDRRLQIWQDTLRDREKMQRKISQKTGRRPSEMLFNFPVTVEERDKANVQRLMDYATRMSPEMLQMKTVAVRPDNFDEDQCTYIAQLQETLPKAEQLGKTTVEITGLTKATKGEMFGKATTANRPDYNTKWLNSKVLEKRIDEKEKDIKNVLEFYPDTENLEVIGNNILNLGKVERDEDITLLFRNSIYSISSDSKVDILDQPEDELKDGPFVPMQEPINTGIKINDQKYIGHHKRSSQLIYYNTYFECHPYQRQLKTVLRLENIGRRVVSCMWININKDQSQLLDLQDTNQSDDFLLDNPKFLVFPGEVRLINVVYQPQTVSLCRQQLELKIFPNVFCNRHGKVILKVIGKCLPGPEYTRIINRNVQRILEKSKKQVADNLVIQQAALAQLPHSPATVCPFERSLDEREIFNAQNTGYHCDRFDDIEFLKALYNAVKLPRQSHWDFDLSTLRAAILRLPQPEERERHFQSLVDLLETLKCSVDCQLNRFEHGSERERSCFVYVRGCIGNVIEEWETLMISVEQTALKSELIRFNAKLLNRSNENSDDSSDDEKSKPWLRQLKLNQPEHYVLRKLRSKKYFRDSLYVLTYTQICDMVENIVSIIESTEII